MVQRTIRQLVHCHVLKLRACRMLPFSGDPKKRHLAKAFLGYPDKVLGHDIVQADE